MPFRPDQTTIFSMRAMSRSSLAAAQAQAQAQAARPMPTRIVYVPIVRLQPPQMSDPVSVPDLVPTMVPTLAPSASASAFDPSSLAATYARLATQSLPN